MGKGRKPSWFGKEPELQRLFAYNEKWHLRSNRQIHLEMGGQLLRRTLLRRDYCRAYKIYSYLIGYRHLSEQLVWKIGTEILRQNQEYEPLCLRFLQLIFAKSTFCKESILVETALYQLRCGKLEDAHATLAPYITMYPYSDNSLIQGYAGVIEFALWVKHIREKRKRKHPGIGDNSGNGEDGNDDWMEEEEEEGLDAEQWNARILRHERAASRLIERSFELDSKNDMFLAYLVRLRCGNIDFAGLGSRKISRNRKVAIHEMKSYLKRFYNKNNDSLLALQLLAALENRESQQTLELILRHDPAADSKLYVQPLLSLLKQSIPSSQKRIVLGLDPSNETERHRSESAAGPAEGALHGKEVKGLRPILRVLLMRAEFGVLTEWEEQELIRICDLVCFCPICSGPRSNQQSVLANPTETSYFDSLPAKEQPVWYSKVAAIMDRD
ncbi:hypothetical protein EDD21DRAFT_381088 [Dissophora ornata]|nr:hypothetical protein EDD21DRAFT_381088 [Dissophora ornata]